MLRGALHYARKILRLLHCLVDMPRRVCELERSVQALAELQGETGPARAPTGEAGRMPPLLVSVVMPTRNRANVIGEAIRSVQAQSHPDWELLVVDDASHDRTEALVTGLALADPRIRYLRQETAVGVSKARNLAIAAARGDVIAYLDDDNTYYPGYLAAVAGTYAEQPDLQCAYAGQLWVETAQRVMVTFDRFSWQRLWSRDINVDMNIFSHRKSLAERLGGHDERLRRHGDWDLILRYTAESAPYRIPVMAVRYDWGGEARITNNERSAAAEQLIREKWLAKPGPRPLRVLFVVYDYPQLSESYIHTEIQWLLRQGVQVEVHATSAPVSPGRAQVPLHGGDLADCVARTRPDLIHVHWMSLARHHGRTLDRLGLPVTIRAHGFDYSDGLARKLLAKPWLAGLYLFPNLIPPELSQHPKLRAMPAAVDVARYHPAGAKNRRLVLRAGACLPTKDLELFFEVAALRPEFQFKLVLSTNTHGYKLAQQLRRLNESLGNPVEILADLQYDRMGELMREAGVYLHTFGFKQPFGQPVSVAEAMACGTIPLMRRAEPTRAYGGDAALYYASAQDAADILLEMLGWRDEQWQQQALRCIERACSGHADDVVFQPLLDDWTRLRH